MRKVIGTYLLLGLSFVSGVCYYNGLPQTRNQWALATAGIVAWPAYLIILLDPDIEDSRNEN